MVAIHSVVFGGFSPEALAGRIEDCNSSLIITADEGIRGGKKIPLKNNTDEALLKLTVVKNVLLSKELEELSIGRKVEIFGITKLAQMYQMIVSQKR